MEDSSAATQTPDRGAAVLEMGSLELEEALAPSLSAEPAPTPATADEAQGSSPPEPAPIASRARPMSLFSQHFDGPETLEKVKSATPWNTVRDKINHNVDVILGAGTFGTAMPGFHLEWGGMVEVKTLSLARKGFTAELEHTLNETKSEMLVAETLGRNPHIITHQFFYDQECKAVFSITPWCGASLENVISGTSILLDEVSGTRLSSHITSGVRHMHAGGVIHGDLSMSNISIQQDTHGMLAQVKTTGHADHWQHDPYMGQPPPLSLGSLQPDDMR
jgi:serine/threonine protein kinase